MGRKSDLKVGEKVFFIPHGVGVVDKFEKKTILDQQKEYMIVKIIETGMTVMLPVEESFSTNKLRKISPKSKLKEVYKILEEDAADFEKNWKTRKENNQQLLLEGELENFAEIVKTLYDKNQEKPLSYTEKNLIKKVFTFMVNEVSIVLGKNKKDVVITLIEKLGDDKEMNAFLISNF
jgi:CarD family transcriptional regulator